MLKFLSGNEIKTLVALDHFQFSGLHLSLFVIVLCNGEHDQLLCQQKYLTINIR